MQSVERAAAMLQLLADEEEPLTLGQIATALDLAKEPRAVCCARWPRPADAAGLDRPSCTPGRS